jgi:ferredoxin
VQLYRVTFVTPHREFSLEVAETEFLWKAAADHGVELPHRCLIGWCLSCAARLDGPGEVDQSLARRYYPQDREAGFVLLCTARPRSALRVITHQKDAMRRHREGCGLPAPL